MSSSEQNIAIVYVMFSLRKSTLTLKKLDQTFDIYSIQFGKWIESESPNIQSIQFGAGDDKQYKMYAEQMLNEHLF